MQWMCNGDIIHIFHSKAICIVHNTVFGNLDHLISATHHPQLLTQKSHGWFPCGRFLGSVARCPSLAAVEDGTLVMPDTIPGTTATFSCNDGFVMSGSTSVVCQNDGSWNGSAPTCRGDYNITIHHNQYMRVSVDMIYGSSRLSIDI